MLEIFLKINYRKYNKVKKNISEVHLGLRIGFGALFSIQYLYNTFCLQANRASAIGGAPNKGAY